jgi:hypothetical protein
VCRSEDDVLETCRVKNVNIYIEKLCVMLVIYQESSANVYAVNNLNKATQ